MCNGSAKMQAEPVQKTSGRVVHQCCHLASRASASVDNSRHVEKKRGGPTGYVMVLTSVLQIS